MAYIHAPTRRVLEHLPSEFGNTTGGFHLLTDQERTDWEGVYPLTDIRPPLTDRQHYGAPTIEQVGDAWTRTWPVINRPVESWEVDAERDRRTDAGIEFNGYRFQSRPIDRENVAGSVQMAFMAQATGAQPRDFFWHNGVEPFGWITEDNTKVPMDAPTVIAFGLAMAAHKYKFIHAGRALKDMDPIPLDFADDSWWA